jgi:hypothetical protein
MAKRMAKDKPMHYKRETIVESAERVVGEIEGDLRCFLPTVLKDKGVQRAKKELERKLSKVDRVLREYKRVNLFTAADLFADVIKTRRANKSEFTTLDLSVFQKAFREFRDNFSEFLRMVADILERKPERGRATHYGYDSEINAAYDEAFNRCNAWYIEAIKDRTRANFSKYPDIAQKLLETGVMPRFAEFLTVLLEQNPKSKLLSAHADTEERRSLRRKGYSWYTERSLRRSLERLGLVIRPDKRGRPRKK